MNRKFKFLKFLMMFIVFATFLGVGSKVLAAQEFVLYKVTYHSNYTPASPDVVDPKYNNPNFIAKNVGTGPEEVNFKHPMLLYRFQGWSTSPSDGTVDYAPGEPITFSGWFDQNLDLYAVWKPMTIRIPYNLKYHANYPPGSMLMPIDYNESHFAGDTVTARPANTYAGADGTRVIGGKTYEFAGWSLTKTGGAEYYPGETFTMPAKNIDLYGVWTTKPVLNKRDHYAYMQGYPEGTFGPTRNMLRSEAVVMFSRLLTNKMNETTTYTSTYVDIPLGRWYSNQIGYMQQKGVLSTPAPYFRPDDPITRAEFADLACGFENLTTGAPNMFSDVPTTHPYYDQINYAVERGWLKGYPDGTFRPDDHIQRAEVIAIVNRVLERYPDQAYIDTHKSMLKQYTDMNLPYWAYYLIMEASNGHNYIKDGATETWTSLK